MAVRTTPTSQVCCATYLVYGQFQFFSAGQKNDISNKTSFKILRKTAEVTKKIIMTHVNVRQKIVLYK